MLENARTPRGFSSGAATGDGPPSGSSLGSIAGRAGLASLLEPLRGDRRVLIRDVCGSMAALVPEYESVDQSEDGLLWRSIDACLDLIEPVCLGRPFDHARLDAVRATMAVRADHGVPLEAVIAAVAAASGAVYDSLAVAARRSGPPGVREIPALRAALDRFADWLVPNLADAHAAQDAAALDARHRGTASFFAGLLNGTGPAAASGHSGPLVDLRAAHTLVLARSESEGDAPAAFARAVDLPRCWVRAAARGRTGACGGRLVAPGRQRRAPV